VISASGLSNVESRENDELESRIAAPFRKRNNIFTAIPLSSFKNAFSHPATVFVKARGDLLL
jgi:hypothetical protein